MGKRASGFASASAGEWGSEISGFQYQNILASYAHLHFGSNQAFVESLLGALALSN